MENNIKYYIEEVKRKDALDFSDKCIEGIVRGLIDYGLTLSELKPIEAIVSIGLGYDVDTGDICQNLEENRNNVIGIIADVINGDEETIESFRMTNPEFEEVTAESAGAVFLWYYGMFHCGFYSVIEREDIESLPEKSITRTPNKVMLVNGEYVINGLRENVVVGSTDAIPVSVPAQFPLNVGYLYTAPEKAYYTDELYEQALQIVTPLNGFSDIYASRLLCGVDLRNNCITEAFYGTYADVVTGIDFAKATVREVVSKLQEDGTGLEWDVINDKVLSVFNEELDKYESAITHSAVSIAKRVFTLYLQDVTFALEKFLEEDAGMDDISVAVIATQNDNYERWEEFTIDGDVMYTATRNDSDTLYFNRVTVTDHMGTRDRLMFISGNEPLLIDSDLLYTLTLDDGVIGSDEVTEVIVDTQLNSSLK